MIGNLKTADLILQYLGFSEETRPLLLYASYAKINKSQYNVDKNELYVLEGLDDDVLLMQVFHECWHAWQKLNGRNIGYKVEDKKYINNNRAFMLYKYDFEAEATGYACAFVYFVYKMRKKYFNEKCEDLIVKYSKPDLATISDVETKKDLEKVNANLEKFYKMGINYFKKMVPPNLLNDNLPASLNLEEEKKNSFVKLVLKIFN